MSAQTQQIENLIASIVITMEEQGVDIIRPEYVSAMVDGEIDPDKLSPEAKTHLSILQTRQLVRAYLRKRHDPVVRSQDTNLSLFSDELQPYYPKGIEGYTQRHLLTMEERHDIAERMRRSADTLNKHADALIAEGEILLAQGKG